MIPPALPALTARLTRLGILLLGFDLGHLCAAAPPGPLPSLATALAAKSDLWGEAAMAQPNGASYEFFAPLLPPPRYVNADFRYYPIVLSPPNAIVKARLISNGSGVNLRGGTRSWHDNGTPFTFRVGPDELMFGSFRDRTSEPTLAEGWLPIAEIRYRHISPVQSEGAVPLTQVRPQRIPEIYRLEAFASTDPAFAAHGVTFVKFDLAQGTAGTITVTVDDRTPVTFSAGTLTNEKGEVLAVFDAAWKWERQRATAKLTATKGATFALATKPLPASVTPALSQPNGPALSAPNGPALSEPNGPALSAPNGPALSAPNGPALSQPKGLVLSAPNGPALSQPNGPALSQPKGLVPDYAAQRAICVATWRSLLAGGMSVVTPEPLVNDAWRHLLAQNFELISGHRMHYSAGNQYNQLYEAEGSDAALALMTWGYAHDTRRLLEPLLDFTRKGLEQHQAGFKLADVCRYYWQTRDADSVRALRPRWEKAARLLVETRTGPHGLFPPERYAGDISTPAQSVNVNANGWRALRDLSAVLAEIGEPTEAARYAAVAREIRPTVLAAIARSARRETTPPFVPIALHSDEPAHDPIIRSRIGSYWNIIIGYTIGSGIFPPGSVEESWIPRYQEQHGGIFMGMVRSGGDEFNFWTGSERVNPLYGTRYTLDTLRRDDPERALVSFYGMLAQGFTRNTFISGEGAALTPVDADGRIFYCPPNSAANAHFLSMLRAMLVQDTDLDDDGRPETLRLLFATPKRWLADGQAITVERAPTVFGEVSVTLTSHLAAGEIRAEVSLPARQNPTRTLLRARVPDGWRVTKCLTPTGELPTDPRGTVDLTALRGQVSLRFQVVRAAAP